MMWFVSSHEKSIQNAHIPTETHPAAVLHSIICTTRSTPVVAGTTCTKKTYTKQNRWRTTQAHLTHKPNRGPAETSTERHAPPKITIRQVLPADLVSTSRSIDLSTTKNMHACMHALACPDTRLVISTKTKIAGRDDEGRRRKNRRVVLLLTHPSVASQGRQKSGASQGKNATPACDTIGSVPRFSCADTSIS